MNIVAYLIQHKPNANNAPTVITTMPLSPFNVVSSIHAIEQNTLVRERPFPTPFPPRTYPNSKHT